MNPDHRATKALHGLPFLTTRTSVPEHFFPIKEQAKQHLMAQIRCAVLTASNVSISKIMLP